MTSESNMKAGAAGTSQRLGERLHDVLPPWAHYTRGMLGFIATWTTPGGTWDVKQELFKLTVTTSYGQLTGMTLDQAVAVLRVLGGLDSDVTDASQEADAAAEDEDVKHDEDVEDVPESVFIEATRAAMVIWGYAETLDAEGFEEVMTEHISNPGQRAAVASAYRIGLADCHRQSDY